MDYAKVHLFGRAVGNAKFSGIGDKDKSSRASFDLAINISVKRNGEWSTKAIYKKIVVHNFYANYVYKCQSEDLGGLKGRIVIINGNLDIESCKDFVTNEMFDKEIVRVTPPCGVINIIDRRVKS